MAGPLTQDIGTARVLSVAFCSFDRQYAAMYTDVRTLCIAVKRQKVEVCDGRTETGEVRSFEQRRKRQLASFRLGLGLAVGIAIYMKKRVSR